MEVFQMMSNNELMKTFVNFGPALEIVMKI